MRLTECRPEHVLSRELEHATVREVSRRGFLVSLGAMSAVAVFAPVRGSLSLGSTVVQQDFQLSAIKALTFDVGGTVFGWHRVVRDEVARLSRRKGFRVDPAKFTNAWRRGMLEVKERVRRGELSFMNIDQIHRMVLDDLLKQQSITALDENEKQELTHAWHRIKPWPDARSGLAKLRTRFTVACLSILSFSLLVNASKTADIHWDALISCEFLGYYKPDPLAYQRGVKLLGYQPHEAMMVGAHPDDLRGARNAGLRTAYVPRRGEYGDDEHGWFVSGAEFDIVAEDFNDLAEQLGAA